MLVVGDREVEERTVAVRRHKEGDQGALSLDDVRSKLRREVGGTRGHPCPSGYRFTVDVRVSGCSPVFGRALADLEPIASIASILRSVDYAFPYRAAFLTPSAHTS